MRYPESGRGWFRTSDLSRVKRSDRHAYARFLRVDAGIPRATAPPPSRRSRPMAADDNGERATVPARRCPGALPRGAARGQIRPEDAQRVRERAERPGGVVVV